MVSMRAQNVTHRPKKSPCSQFSKFQNKSNRKCFFYLQMKLSCCKILQSSCRDIFLVKSNVPQNTVAMFEHGVDIDGNFFEVSLVSEPHVEIKFLTRQFGSLMNNFSLLCVRTELEAETCGMGLFARVCAHTHMRIATCVRYVNFRLHQNKTVPPYLKTQAGLGKAPCSPVSRAV